MSPAELKGRVALVTGGARGIGRAIAQALAAQGAAIAVMDINGAGAAETAALVGRQGVPAHVVTADVSDYDAVKAGLAAIRAALGAPSIVVCNAGIAGEPTLFREETKAAWTRNFQVNVDGTFHCLRETFPAMLQTGWGRIVVISSIAATVGWRGASSYAAAKAALLGLMRTLALEGASKGVTANAVLPGVVDTEMARQSLVKVRDKVEAAIPMKRIGRPEDIANAVAFLCSERAAFITGQCLSPNGGMWMG